MNDNSDAQYESLLDTATTFATQTYGAEVDSNTVFYCLQSLFMKMIEYCLPVTHLTVRQWDKIMSKALSAALPKCGYSFSIPLALRYGALRHRWVGIHHPYYWGEILKLCTYLQEQVCGTQTGALITVSAKNL